MKNSAEIAKKVFTNGRKCGIIGKQIKSRMAKRKDYIRMDNKNKNQKSTKNAKGTYRYKKNNKTYNIRIDRIVACLVIIVVLIVLICSCVKSCGKSKKDSSGTTATMENTEQQTVGTEAAPAETEGTVAKTISMNSDDVYCGDLVLIDGSNPYQFKESLNIQPIADLKNDCYTTSDLVISLDSNTINSLNSLMEAFNTETGISDIRIISAYRTYDEQQEKYSSGSASTAPGYSEYHTARTFSMAIFSSDGTSDYFKPDGDYAWVKEHAAEYGFIQRYPEGKDNYTGESEITYIYRYVGVPHALYMYQNGMCLEEYISAVKNYTFESPLTISGTDGSSYLVYYVPASSEGSTAVQIPENSQYEVSGNNSDGFIVTVIN